MAEQKYTPEITSSYIAASFKPDDLPPVEGRVDVAGDLEEEQRAAYSAHHHAAPSPGGETARKSRVESGAQSTRAPTFKPDDLPPVEGRIDVAGDLEEEQRDAYSAHHV